MWIAEVSIPLWFDASLSEHLGHQDLFQIFEQTDDWVKTLYMNGRKTLTFHDRILDFLRVAIKENDNQRAITVHRRAAQ